MLPINHIKGQIKRNRLHYCANYKLLVLMQQIRQKNQSFRKQIRREYLDKKFKQYRKEYFGFDSQRKNDSQQTLPQKHILSILIKQSLVFNGIQAKIRQNNFLFDLDQYVTKAIKSRNNDEKKYILAIISNTFNDELDVFQKQQLFRISLRLFKSFEISFTNFSKPEQQKHFKNILQSISVETLSFYFSQVMAVSLCLQEIDQQQIQNFIYEAFQRMLFYCLKNGDSFLVSENFNYDMQKCLVNIFDNKQESYETGNRMKVLRKSSFFSEIVINHYFYLEEKEVFQSKFALVEARLFWVYARLTDYYDQIESLFKQIQFFRLIQKSLLEEYSAKKVQKFRFIFSIIRTLIDKQIHLEQIEVLLFHRNGNLENKPPLIQRLFDSMGTNLKKQFFTIDLLEGILISYQQHKNFKQIIDVYGFKLTEMCVNLLRATSDSFLNDQICQKVLRKVLGMIQVLIDRGNKSITKKPNQFIIRFDQLGGIQIINDILFYTNEALTEQSNPDLKEVSEIMDWIVSENLQLSDSD